MLTEALKAGQILNEEKLAFLADLGIPDGQATQTTILNNDAFQTEDPDAYDSNRDDVLNAKAILMANLSNYSSDFISEEAVQDTNLYAQQDSMILSVIDRMSEQMINHELQVHVRDSCPNAYKPSAKLPAVTLKNKVKRVRIEVFY
uniref:Integrase, catalytic region, zinc finger, CCHC-type, peptidase aspartic, catalytic n=1 Tax=Tanacetum cinerariifolium TaxID=118510 RepID=A0A699JCX9_TANCI|nr:hypothetical protein [Tanacetum cinerariifolium]